MTKHPWFVKERALAFAHLALTGTEDVALRSKSEEGESTDLLVELLKSKRPTMRFLGVRLVAAPEMASPAEAEALARPLLETMPPDGSLPVCVFAIGSRGPSGFWRWVVEPVVREGEAVLEERAKADWQELDESSAGRMIEQAREWYEARAAGFGKRRAAVAGAV